MFCIDDSEHRLQDAYIGKHLFCHSRQIKHHIHISDSIGLYLMEDYWNPRNIHLLINDRLDIPGNIFSFKNWNLRQVFFIIRRRLVCFQRFGALHQHFLLPRREAVLVSLQLLLQFSVPLSCTALLWLYDHDGAMGVV